MPAPYDAMTIAKWFVAYASNLDADRSNLKIQKLLYYAQGHHLGTGRGALFDDEIQAWSHGPVVPSVYHQFKHYGSADVTGAFDYVFDTIDEETQRFLIDVWDAYAPRAPWVLRGMTHNEPPWRDAFDGTRNKPIPVQAMQRYFATRNA